MNALTKKQKIFLSNLMAHEEWGSGSGYLNTQTRNVISRIIHHGQYRTTMATRLNEIADIYKRRIEEQQRITNNSTKWSKVSCTTYHRDHYSHVNNLIYGNHTDPIVTGKQFFFYRCPLFHLNE